MKRIGFRLLCRLCGLLLAMLLLLQALAPMACAEERKTVRVGFFAFDGYHMMDENGERSGYGYDFLRMAARYMDVDYEYVGYENGWNDMLDMLRDGRIDLVTSAQVTQERMAEFAFSKPIGSSSAMLTVFAENQTLESGRYSEYDGIHIGLLKRNSRNADLREFAKLHNFPIRRCFLNWRRIWRRRSKADGLMRHVQALCAKHRMNVCSIRSVRGIFMQSSARKIRNSWRI